METKCISIRLNKETQYRIEQTIVGKNISEKIRNILESQYLTLAELTLKKKEYEQKLELIDLEIKKNIFSNYFTFPEKEEMWLKETAKFLKTPGNDKFMVGKYNYYQNVFHRLLHYNDFRLLIEKYK